MDSIFLFSVHDPLLIKIFFWVTLLGKSEVIALFVVVASAALLLLRKRPEIFGLWISVVGSAVFVFLGKIVFGRPRPPNPVYFETSASFPSGHAAAAAAFYGFLAYLIFRFGFQFSKYKKISITGIIVCLAIILAVGFSRLYLGVHYASDVLGGYFLGLLWLAIGITVSEWKSKDS